MFICITHYGTSAALPKENEYKMKKKKRNT